ncbi:KN motif and ankyrin repeat domain-containing protein 1b isoform X2 [Brachyhypopomus gauderio]|uniref:KN motif and ankyrin repeat domain-containing protein 1b isoform X2 n=1 Tax=Brachyhypopomus gauderio TaxID=698409 RepID=UPI004042DA3B
MAQDGYVYMNRTDTCETSAETFQSSPFYLATPYNYQLDLDFLKYVEDIEKGNTIRRLGFSRRPRANPVSETQSGVECSHGVSSKSLSSGGSKEARNPATISSSACSSINQRRPPLPPSYSSPKSTSEALEHSKARPTCQRPSERKSPQATTQCITSKPNPLVERTLMETRRRLEQEKVSSQTVPPEQYPRRRLASFGGLGSSGTFPPRNQIQTASKVTKLTAVDQTSPSASPHGGSYRISPVSSGLTTPVTSISPLHLQMVRDQMVVVLERLRELEEQVKTIPVLQVKISVLQEEKRQLIGLVNDQGGQILRSNLDPDLQGLFRKRAHSTGNTLQFQEITANPEKDEGGQREFSEEPEGWEHGSLSGLKEFRQLSAEMQLLEKRIQDARLTAQINSNSHAKCGKPEVVADDKNVYRDSKDSVSSCMDVGVETRLDTRSAAVGVTEAMLGVVSETESELEMQQQTIQVLMDRTQTLEAELKEALLKAEMCRLKSELREAGARNRTDKGSSAQPKMQNAASQMEVQTQTVGVGTHIQLIHAAVGGGSLRDFNTVGVICRPDTRDVASGPDVAMEIWEVHKRVEKRDQCVGKGYVPMEKMGKTKVSSRTVGCGDCTVDVSISMVKPLVSQGTVTDPLRDKDLGVVVTRQTRSQQTTTAVHTVSRWTSTEQLLLSESSTNTTNTITHERHTNTAQVITRTLAIGDGKVSDRETAVKVRSVGVGTAVHTIESAITSRTLKVTTRDTGTGLANVNENFLVGLRTRNIACGPSRLPDPTTTRSVAVEVGDGRIRAADGQAQTPVQQPHLYTQSELGLDHYIDRMQRLIKEQQSLLTDSHFDQREEVTLQSQDNLCTHHRGSLRDDVSLRSDIRRKDLRQSSADSRKSLASLSPGFEHMTISEDSSDFEEEEERKRKREPQLEEGPKTSTKPSKMERRERYDMSEKMLFACRGLKAHLSDSSSLSSRELRSCLNTVQQEWFRVSSQRRARPDVVEDFLRACRRISPAVLSHVTNMADRNGNTALHYTVSHSNFRVVQVLLDAGVCNVNQQNQAGYTPIMLAALAAVETQEDMSVVEELFRKGDVNAKAIQAFAFVCLCVCICGCACGRVHVCTSVYLCTCAFVFVCLPCLVM